LVMPCGNNRRFLPKWESLEVLEYEHTERLEPWDSIPTIEEVWKIRDLV
jgi:hypothetical protein